MSTHHTIGDIIEVRVEKIVPRGFGLGFAENLTVLTPLAVPGDKLRVRITDVKKRTAFASIVDVLERGPRRIEPQCEYFGRCGGCDLQQISYPAQLQAKVGILRDCLQRIGKLDAGEDIEIIASPSEFGYRSRARWHLDRSKRKLGYFRRDSHDIIDITSCPILTPGLQSTLEYTRESLDWDSVWSENAEIEAATGEDGRVSLFSEHLGEPTAELLFANNGDQYIFSAKSFFQANKFLIERLVTTALDGLNGGLAYDLYSGVGLFTLPLARRFEQVVSVEGDSTSAEFLRRNVENARITNVQTINSSTVDFLSGNPHSQVDLVLLDPPRSGTEKRTLPAIINIRPKAISYVSCEPSILARDLRILLDAGYSIDRITALDLFPQTHHVETIVILRDKTER